MNRIVHFEIPSADTAISTKFYGDIFGWTFNRFGPQDYWLIETGPANQPGINGAIMRRNDPKQPVTNSIEVENIDVIGKKIEQMAGQIVVPKTTIPGVGYFAFFKDPDGNIMGLWQNDVGAK